MDGERGGRLILLRRGVCVWIGKPASYLLLFDLTRVFPLSHINLGEAAWSTGLPPSRSHHLAIFLRFAQYGTP